MRPMIHFIEIVEAQDADLPNEIMANVLMLLFKLNTIRFRFGRPMIVSSGFRSPERHEEIYLEKGFTRDQIPWGSMHLLGAAADIFDPDQALQKWVYDNYDFVEKLGLWIEDFDYTKTWVHFQIYPFKSYQDGGSIYFKPF